MVRSVNPNTGVKGMDKVLSNLNKAIRTMEVKSAQGMLAAATYLLKDMDTTPPKIPIDLENLRASQFITPLKIGGKPVVMFGFDANYALFVHEMVDGSINWKRPGSGPKFMEASINRNKTKILEIIASYTKIR